MTHSCVPSPDGPGREGEEAAQETQIQVRVSLLRAPTIPATLESLTLYDYVFCLSV